MVSGSEHRSGPEPPAVRVLPHSPEPDPTAGWAENPAGGVERPVGLMVRIGGGVAVLGCATWIAVEGVPQWERRLFESLNGGPAGLELVLWLPMQLGSLFGPFVVGGVAWWRLRRWRPAVGSVLVGVLAWQLAKVLKAAVERGRPFSLMNDFARRAGTPYEGLGFVSGHSAVAYAVAAVVAPYVSRSRRGLIWALATVVGLSRIQVSAHMPLDVVGGAGLGFVVGNAWNLAVGLPASEVPGT